jgi:hypothetical protein
MPSARADEPHEQVVERAGTVPHTRLLMHLKKNLFTFLYRQGVEAHLPDIDKRGLRQVSVERIVSKLIYQLCGRQIIIAIRQAGKFTLRSTVTTHIVSIVC